MKEDQIVLKHDELFVVCNELGDIEPTGLGAGFYFRDMRHLSILQLRLEGSPLELLDTGTDAIDHLTVYLDLENGLVKDVGFQGSGCAISKAAASMMTQAVKGKSKEQAENLFNEFHQMVTGELNEEIEENRLGNLKIFAGVREFPVRVKCATLPWHTLQAALNKEDKVSTE